ncbi:DUF4145 domain-containing protein [Aquimarina sp. LLG6339-5]|uniref:DUF4145 domain-containing protein n=1 Tax=Aquimarina sp. LLG6339-5 TaxID=3160830 RepID=UPI003870E864
MTYIQPKIGNKSFTCPHCNVLAEHRWSNVDPDNFKSHNQYSGDKDKIYYSTCILCRKSTIWINFKMYYPDTGNMAPPNIEMPEKVKNLYLEAASICNKSPRGAAALLRLSIQILCKELGEEGENINNDIKELVKKGLPKEVQQSLDIVRVTGNDAVHPGTIDTDDIAVVTKLFGLINVIVKYRITLPKEVNDIYQGLPENKLQGIINRDS